MSAAEQSRHGVDDESMLGHVHSESKNTNADFSISVLITDKF